MKEEIIFCFESVIEKDNFNSILPDDVIAVQKRRNANKSFFVREDTKLNVGFDANTILTLLISGGTISAIIMSIKELVIKYWELKNSSKEKLLEKNQGKIVIQKGSRRIELELNDVDKDWRAIIGNELIESLFISEGEE